MTTKELLKRPRQRRQAFVLAIVLPLAVYGGLAVARIGARVGYQMDEGLYVESAVFVLRGGSTPCAPRLSDWVLAHGRRWPLMIMPYVGTAKAAVALPLFALFGVTPAAARVAGVLLGGLGIGGLAALLAARVRPAAGLLAGLLLAVHPSYLDFTVFDNGGASVWMGSMGLAAVALNSHLSRGSRLSAFLLGAAAGAGIWARANFVWLIAAAIAGALLGFGRAALPRRGHLPAIAAGGLCGSLPLLLYEAGSRLGTWTFFLGARRPFTPEIVPGRLVGLFEVMISDGEQRGIWGGPPLPGWQLATGALLLLGAGALVAIPLSPEDPRVSRWRRALAGATIALTLLLLGSRLNVSQHHMVAVLPLALAALTLFAVENGLRKRGAVVLAAGGAILSLALSLGWDLRIERGLTRTRGVGFWSDAIDDAGAVLAAHPVPVSRLKILSWGLQKNLYVVTGGAIYGRELFWNATASRSSRGLGWEEEIREGGVFLMTAFPAGAPELDEGARGFAAALASYSGPRRERVFPDRSGRPVVRGIEIPPGS